MYVVGRGRHRQVHDDAEEESHQGGANQRGCLYRIQREKAEPAARAFSIVVLYYTYCMAIPQPQLVPPPAVTTHHIAVVTSSNSVQ